MATLIRFLLSRPPVILMLAFTTLAPAHSADIEADQRVRARVTIHRHYVLPPDRHVVEKVMPPYSGNYLINGTWFMARTPACTRWVAGERIRLVAGDWHRGCSAAVIHNVARRMTCELSCG
jgi:hypothetical protein